LTAPVREPFGVRPDAALEALVEAVVLLEFFAPGALSVERGMRSNVHTLYVVSKIRRIVEAEYPGAAELPRRVWRNLLLIKLVDFI
jgi:hypothetical protein